MLSRGNMASKTKAPSKKKKATPKEMVDVVNEVGNNIVASQTVPKERNRMTALVEINVDEVDAIFASSKTRGNYDRVMVEFLEKGIQGAGVPLEGPFADRQLNSLKTGFESARNRVIENK